MYVCVTLALLEVLHRIELNVTVYTCMQTSIINVMCKLPHIYSIDLALSTLIDKLLLLILPVRHQRVSQEGVSL